SPPLRSPLFPYTTLFRSSLAPRIAEHGGDDRLAELLYELPGNYFDGDALLLPVVVSRSLPSLRLAAIPDRESLDVFQWVPLLRRSEEHTSELQSPYDLVC